MDRIDCNVLDGSCVAVIVAGMSGFVEVGVVEIL